MVLTSAVLLQGDWGTQFGMLIQYLAEAREAGLADPTIADLTLPELQVHQPSFAHVKATAFCTSAHLHMHMQTQQLCLNLMLACLALIISLVLYFHVLLHGVCNQLSESCCNGTNI